MPGGFRSVYQDDSIKLTRDASVTATENLTVTATNFVYAGGVNTSFQIQSSFSGHTGLTIQGNNSNYIDSSICGTIKYTINPLMNQPTMGTRHNARVNPSFTANWVNIDTIATGITFKTLTGIPVRYVRLTGTGLTATNFVCHVWSSENVEGN